MDHTLFWAGINCFLLGMNFEAILFGDRDLRPLHTLLFLASGSLVFYIATTN